DGPGEIVTPADLVVPAGERASVYLRCVRRLPWVGTTRVVRNGSALLLGRREDDQSRTIVGEGRFIRCVSGLTTISKDGMPWPAPAPWTKSDNIPGASIHAAEPMWARSCIVSSACL